ncbi:MAG: hypothetical protein R2706_08000 [Acidimicrobiales bacterium]
MIDASSQPGYVSQPLIEVYGGGAVANGFRLAAASDSTTLRGFAIGGFSNSDVNISGDNHTVAGNYFGVTRDGVTAFPTRTGFASVYVTGTGTVIGGALVADRNIIANAQNGVIVDGSGTSNITISRNFIGVNLSGNAVALNTFDGVRIQNGVTGAIVGGPTAAYGNVIASGQDGVQIDGETTDGAIVRNNLIGVGADGTTATTIGGSGVVLWGGPDSTVIRGNIIGNVTGTGIWLDGASLTTTIAGNLLGVDVLRNPHPIQQNGILIEKQGNRLDHRWPHWHTIATSSLTQASASGSRQASPSRRVST